MKKYMLLNIMVNIVFKKSKKSIINLGDTGSFWIDKTFDNFFVKNGRLVYYDGIVSYDNSFDSKILDKAIFVQGYFEYDKFKK